MKRLLIDSHILIWALTEPEKLKSNHKELLEDISNEVLVSVASLWELYIKANLKKLELPENLHAELDNRSISILSIQKRHLDTLLNLSHHHRDPFDRLIIAQSISEDLPLISYDSQFKNYQVELVSF